MTETTTLTFKGSCKENIDGNAWYKDNELPNLDYVTYKNKGGIKIFAKEIEMGNFKACIIEHLRSSK